MNKNPIRYIKNTSKLMFNYWQYTKSVSFMFKLSIIEFFNVCDWVFGGRLENVKHFIFGKIGGKHCFDTPFGYFIANTVNGYTVIQENYEPDIRNVIIDNVNRNKNNKNKVFINIGTHIGRYMVEIGKIHKYSVIGFEPSPNTFKMLTKNIILNEIYDSNLYNMALGDKKGILEFEYFKSHDGGSRILQGKSKLSNYAKIINVNVSPFDDIINNRIIKDVRLIIMDVEGFELSVINGMLNFLRKCNNLDIIIEIFENSKNKQEIFSIMKNNGFNITQITKDDWLFYKGYDRE